MEAGSAVWMSTMTLIPPLPLDDLSLFRSERLDCLVQESHDLIRQAIDNLIFRNVAKPAALEQANLMLTQRLHLSMALLPPGSLDHVLNSAVALDVLRNRTARDCRPSDLERLVVEFVRLVEDAEPQARADFENEAAAKRLKTAVTFLYAELCDWAATAEDARNHVA